MEHVEIRGLPFPVSRIALGTWAIGGRTRGLGPTCGAGRGDPRVKASGRAVLPHEDGTRGVSRAPGVVRHGSEGYHSMRGG
jgi:hypothetical protein